MKKTIVLFSFLLIAFTSCTKSKNYTCSCDCTNASGTTFNRTTTITSSTSSSAQSQCNDFGKSAVNGNGTWQCTIK